MIRKILTNYAAQLDEYLLRKHYQPEGMVEVGFVGSSTEEKPCKLVITLLSIERETSGGVATPVKKSSGGYMRFPAPLLLNLNLVLAVVYDEKRYAESLSVLSNALAYIQSVPSFEFEGQSYTVEIVTLSSQDINNVWTTLGGQYYPSVVCKLRRLVIDSGETAGTGTISKKPDVNL